MFRHNENLWKTVTANLTFKNSLCWCFILDHTKVIYIINCPNIHQFKWEELEKLRSSFNALTEVQYDDILVAGVKSGCVIVTFMIRNCLIPKLKTLYTSKEGSTTSQWMSKLQYKIIKIMVQDEVIFMSGMSLSLTFIFLI